MRALGTGGKHVHGIQRDRSVSIGIQRPAVGEPVIGYALEIDGLPLLLVHSAFAEAMLAVVCFWKVVAHPDFLFYKIILCFVMQNKIQMEIKTTKVHLQRCCCSIPQNKLQSFLGGILMAPSIAHV